MKVVRGFHCLKIKPSVNSGAAFKPKTRTPKPMLSSIMHSGLQKQTEQLQLTEQLLCLRSCEHQMYFPPSFTSQQPRVREGIFLSFHMPNEYITVSVQNHASCITLSFLFGNPRKCLYFQT